MGAVEGGACRRGGGAVEKCTHLEFNFTHVVKDAN
jgi:hypothetical protein